MKLLEKIISIYAPLVCLKCGIEGPVICESCISSLPQATSHCYRCNKLSQASRTCRDCRTVDDQPTNLVIASAAFSYQGVARDLVWKLKFGRVQSAADNMAAAMAKRYGANIAPNVLIVPVPTAAKRVRGRGYDQAVLLAQAFAKHTGCQYASLLLRVGSQEQIGAGKTQRRDQLRGVIHVKDASKVAGARILLIDDVMTTGATLEAAAAALGQAGAKIVGSLVFARAEMESESAKSFSSTT